MIFDVLAFFGLVMGLLVLAAEAGKKPFLGIAAGVLMLVVAFWVQADSITFRSGETRSVSSILSGVNTTSEMNATTNITTATSSASSSSGSEVVTYSYNTALPQITPIMKTEDLLFLVFLLSGLYAIYAYSEEVIATTGK